MKEIERYWEQALLKVLIKKKMAEISRSISVRPEEIAREYEILKAEDPSTKPLDKISDDIRNDIRNRKIQEAFNMWMKDLRRHSSVVINKQTLDEI